MTIKTSEVIDDLVGKTSSAGTYTFPDLIRTVKEKKFHGVGICESRDSKTYILFLSGEPEGAIIADTTGELYGNKAVYLIGKDNRFSLYPLSPQIVEQLVLGCRIYNKNLITRGSSLGIPEFGRKSEGIGRLIITVRKNGTPATGLPVRIRRSGQIIASDVTDRQGSASFRLLYGTYDLLVVREENSIDVYEFSFHQDLHEKPQVLDIS